MKAVGRPSEKIENEEAVVKQAQEFASKLRWDQAIALLEPLLKQERLTILGLEILAFSYSKLKKFRNAISIYQKLCKDQPGKLKWSYGLAYQHYAAGNTKAAIEAFTQCLEIYPDYLKAILRLGIVYESISEKEKAIGLYRKGYRAYMNASPSAKQLLVSDYVKICARAGKLLSDGKDPQLLKKAERLFRECVKIAPQEANNWYRLGSLLLELGEIDQAHEALQTAKALNPNKEYIDHKIALALFKKEDVEAALKTYKQIPQHRRSAYILHGIANCLIMQGKQMDAAEYLYQAVKKEPDKFYHHRDFGIVLADLGDRDQAVDELKAANQLFKNTQGKDHQKILAKIDDVQKLPPGQRIDFEKNLSSTVSAISFGKIANYHEDRGFGFIKDDNDGESNIFFHIKKMKGLSKPSVGMPVKFVKEMGEKGLCASKVWPLPKNSGDHLPA